MKKNVFLLIILLSFLSKGISQSFDSVYVYRLKLHSMYRVKIDKDLIKTQIRPIAIRDSLDVAKMYSFLLSNKGVEIYKPITKVLDIRMLFDFFKRGEVVKSIGVSYLNEMFINTMRYECNSDSLNIHIDSLFF